MKKIFIACLFGLIASAAEAASINRSEFDPTATSFNFTGVATGTTTVTSGGLTVSNGIVSFSSVGSLVAPTYYDGSDSSVIRFNFSSPVSAFGLDFLSNNANITLSLFDAVNNLLESLTIDWTTLPLASGFPNGFIGLNVNSNQIYSATIDTPLNGNELYVDNIIYQTAAQSVPEPETLWLLSIGLITFAFRRKSV